MRRYTFMPLAEQNDYVAVDCAFWVLPTMDLVAVNYARGAKTTSEKPAWSLLAKINKKGTVL